ncbi:MAG: 2-oxoacid:acceptor oxidoreductase family protein [Rikenellaceae bacterium]
MKEELIIAGFGGQGVLSLGKILSYSAVLQGKEVTWYPSYGPEMRGGTANVTVIIDDNKISSPIVHEYDSAILLNQQSIDKFEPLVKPGGVIIYDPNGVVSPPQRKDVTIYEISAAERAVELGNSRFFNVIVLGGYLKVKPIVEFSYILDGLKKSLPARVHKLLPANEAAIKEGMEIIKEMV